jgi:hypothetical protein
MTRWIFLAFMALVGLVAGAIMSAAPPAGDFIVKPYFWVLIAVGLFDLALLVRGAGPGALSMNARAIGFVGGALIMVGLVTLAGSPAKLF